jgi:hypothetical protein
MLALRGLYALCILAFVVRSVAAAQPPMPDDREVHIVCVGRAPFGAARKAEVKVDRPGKRVTLVLGSDQETAWEVAATKETSLTKVILIGLFKQTVGDLPQGVERVEAFSDRMRRVLGIPAPYTAAFPFFRPMIQKLHAMTNTEVVSYHGFPRMPQAPILVNAIQADPWLHSTYPTPEPAEGLPALEFNSLYYGVPGEGQWTAPVFTKFTLAKGPDLNSRIALPAIRLPGDQFGRLVVDPGTGKGYGLSARGLKEIDFAKKTISSLPSLPSVPKDRSPVATGIAFDPRRARLLVASNRNLFAYSPRTGQWDVVCEWLFGGFPVLAYDPRADNLYALEERFADNDEKRFPLSRHDAAGKRLDEVGLSGPLVSGLLSAAPSESTTQLIAVGDMLVLVATLGESISAPGPGLELETFVYLINPKTGLTRPAWKEKTVKLMTMQPRPAPTANH